MPDVFQWRKSQAVHNMRTNTPVSLPLSYTGLNGDEDERVTYIPVSAATQVGDTYEIDAVYAVEICVRDYLQAEQLEGQAAASIDWPCTIEVQVPQYDDWVLVDVWADFDPKFTIEFPAEGGAL